MNIDSETLFNAAAAAVSTIAVIIFIINNQFPYSPVSKVMLVVGFLAGVFAVTQSTEDSQLTLFGYAVIVISTVALLLDLTSTFNVETTGQVLLLLAFALVLFGLRMFLDDGSRFVAGPRAKQAFAALAVLAIVVLTVDVVTGGLAYELQTQQEVQVSGGGEREVAVKLGELVVSNAGPFPQRVDAPNYGICTAGNWSEYQVERSDGEKREVNANLRMDRNYGEHVFGFGEQRYDAVVQLYAENIEGERFLVQQTDGCPGDESGDPYLAVFERTDNPPYGYAL